MIRDFTTVTIADLEERKAEESEMIAALSLKAPLDTPIFTGNPQAPTASAGDNDTSVATTAFVQTEITSGATILGKLAHLMAFAAAHG